jgi:hypothetical protein
MIRSYPTGEDLTAATTVGPLLRTAHARSVLFGPESCDQRSAVAQIVCYVRLIKPIDLCVRHADDALCTWPRLARLSPKPNSHPWRRSRRLSESSFECTGHSLPVRSAARLRALQRCRWRSVITLVGRLRARVGAGSGAEAWRGGCWRCAARAARPVSPLSRLAPRRRLTWRGATASKAYTFLYPDGAAHGSALRRTHRQTVDRRAACKKIGPRRRGAWLSPVGGRSGCGPCAAGCNGCRVSGH